MKKGIKSNAVDYYGNQKYLKLKECGFSCVDFQLVSTETAYYTAPTEEAQELLLKEKKLIEEAGLEISQVHGPWRYPPMDETLEDREERMEKMKKSIAFAALLGCKNWVIHPVFPFGMCDKDSGKEEETYRINLAFMRELLETAKEYDVTVCLENLPFRQFSLGAPADVLRIIRDIDDDHFQMCLDTGHAAVFEGVTPGDALRECADVVRVLHVHDNNGKGDFHWLPYIGVIDWKDFCQALTEIGFDGVFSYETAPNPKMPEPVRGEVLKMMTELADLLVEQ